MVSTTALGGGDVRAMRKRCWKWRGCRLACLRRRMGRREEKLRLGRRLLFLPLLLLLLMIVVMVVMMMMMMTTTMMWLS